MVLVPSGMRKKCKKTSAILGGTVSETWTLIHCCSALGPDPRGKRNMRLALNCFFVIYFSSILWYFVIWNPLDPYIFTCIWFRIKATTCRQMYHTLILWDKCWFSSLSIWLPEKYVFCSIMLFSTALTDHNLSSPPKSQRGNERWALRFARNDIERSPAWFATWYPLEV